MDCIVNWQHCEQRKAPVIQVTQNTILRFFARQGRHVAQMGWNLAWSPLLYADAKLQCNDNGTGPPKLKFLLRYDQNHGLRGIASPALTASQWERAIFEFDPLQNRHPEPITKKFVTGDYVSDTYSCVTFGASVHGGASRWMGEMPLFGRPFVQEVNSSWDGRPWLHISSRLATSV